MEADVSDSEKKIRKTSITELRLAKMDSAQVCRQFKYDFCRFQDLCRYEHVKEVCDDVECSVTLCRKRHPKLCIYFSEFNRCKFGSFCHFKHEAPQILPQCSHQDSLLLSEIEKLKETITSLALENENLKKKVEELDLKVTEVDVGLTIVKEKSSATPLFQVTPSAGYSCVDAMPYDTSISKSVYPQGSSGSVEIVSGRLFPPWSYKTP